MLGLHRVIRLKLRRFLRTATLRRGLFASIAPRILRQMSALTKYPLVRPGLTLLVLSLLAPSPSQLSAQASRAEVEAPDRIYPGDLIKLDVWREKDLSGEFQVDRNGIVVLPLVGRYDVSEETPESFEVKVVSSMQAELANPSIDVTVLRRVRVTGFVREGGVFNLDPTTTVADALAMAGGLGQDGVAGRVLLYRAGSVIASNLDLNLSVYESAIRSGDELRVPQRSWFSRSSGALITGGSAFIGLIVTLIATSGN